MNKRNITFLIGGLILLVAAVVIILFRPFIFGDQSIQDFSENCTITANPDQPLQAVLDSATANETVDATVSDKIINRPDTPDADNEETDITINPTGNQPTASLTPDQAPVLSNPTETTPAKQNSTVTPTRPVVCLNDGKYSNQQLTINKPLILKGLNQNKAIFENSTITIKSNNVQLKHFLFRNADKCIAGSGKKIDIRQNNFTECKQIIVGQFKDAQILANYFRNYNQGVIIADSDGLKIEDNQFRNQPKERNNRVDIEVTNSNNISVAKNIIAETSNEGISLIGIKTSKITDNQLSTVSDGDRYGIRLADSNNNQITGNKILRNGLEGILIENSNNNQITSNTVTESNVGIGVMNASNNTVSQNSLSNNQQGVMVSSTNLHRYGANPATNNKIIDNKISAKMDGILIREATGTITQNNKITNTPREITNLANTSPASSAVNASLSNFVWGDFHTHTDYSDGTGSLADLIKYARDVEKLDFLAVTDHDHLTSDAEFKETINQMQGANSTKFTTFLAYEWSSVKYGHHNIYLPDFKFVNRLITNRNSSDKLTDLFEFVRVNKGFTILHHHSPPERWELTSNIERPLFEIHSIHGRSEYTGNPGIKIGKENVVGGGAFQDGLAKGLHLGVVASSDSHRSIPGQSGLTGIYTTDRTKTGVWLALRNRQTIATTGQKIDLVYDINGKLMGYENLKTNKVKLHLKTKADSSISKIEVVKYEYDGKTPFPTAYEVNPNKTNVEFTWEDPNFTKNAVYYVRLTQADGNMAWASPIWVTKTK